MNTELALMTAMMKNTTLFTPRPANTVGEIISGIKKDMDAPGNRRHWHVIADEELKFLERGRLIPISANLCVHMEPECKDSYQKRERASIKAFLNSDEIADLYTRKRSCIATEMQYRGLTNKQIGNSDPYHGTSRNSLGFFEEGLVTLMDPCKTYYSMDPSRDSLGFFEKTLVMFRDPNPKDVFQRTLDTSKNIQENTVFSGQNNRNNARRLQQSTEKARQYHNVDDVNEFKNDADKYLSMAIFQELDVILRSGHAKLIRSDDMTQAMSENSIDVFDNTFTSKYRLVVDTNSELKKAVDVTYAIFNQLCHLAANIGIQQTVMLTDNEINVPYMGVSVINNSVSTQNQNEDNSIDLLSRWLIQNKQNHTVSDEDIQTMSGTIVDKVLRDNELDISIRNDATTKNIIYKLLQTWTRRKQEESNLDKDWIDRTVKKMIKMLWISEDPEHFVVNARDEGRFREYYHDGKSALKRLLVKNILTEVSESDEKIYQQFKANKVPSLYNIPMHDWQLEFRKNEQKKIERAESSKRYQASKPQSKKSMKRNHTLITDEEVRLQVAHKNVAHPQSKEENFKQNWNNTSPIVQNKIKQQVSRFENASLTNQSTEETYLPHVTQVDPEQGKSESGNFFSYDWFRLPDSGNPYLNQCMLWFAILNGGVFAVSFAFTRSPVLYLQFVVGCCEGMWYLMTTLVGYVPPSIVWAVMQLSRTRKIMNALNKPDLSREEMKETELFVRETCQSLCQEWIQKHKKQNVPVARTTATVLTPEEAWQTVAEKMEQMHQTIEVEHNANARNEMVENFFDETASFLEETEAGIVIENAVAIPDNMEESQMKAFIEAKIEQSVEDFDTMLRWMALANERGIQL